MNGGIFAGTTFVFSLIFNRLKIRLGDEERRLMYLVPAPAVRLMKSRVLSRPGVNKETFSKTKKDMTPGVQRLHIAFLLVFNKPLDLVHTNDGWRDVDKIS